MSLELSLSNLWFYSLQTGILILAAGLLIRFLRLREPRSLYVFWRVLLAVCLLLIFQPGVPDPMTDPVSVPLAEEPMLPVAPVTVSESDQATNLFPMLGVLLVSGVILRMIWLVTGFCRLHRLRRRTRRLVLPPASSAVDRGDEGLYPVSCVVGGHRAHYLWLVSPGHRLSRFVCRPGPGNAEGRRLP